MEKAEGKLSWAESLFVDIFCSLFGEDKRNYLIRHHNVPFKDTEGRTRLHDFVIVTQGKRIAIEIEGESYHNPLLVGEEKYSEDLLRGNAQILQGWLRLSYTPRNLSENVEVVKKQLRELLGGSPIFLDYGYNATDDEISHAKASSEYEHTELEKATTETIDRLLITHHLFREKTRNLFTQSSPTPQDFLDYIIGRGMIQILHEYEDRGHTASVQHIESLTRMHDQESTRDALRLIQVLPLLSPENDHGSYNVLRTALTGWADESEHNPARLRSFAISIRALHTGVYVRFQITPSGDRDKEFFSREEFKEQLWLLWLGYIVLSMLFQYLSLKLGRARTAIIGVTEGGGEFCYTILDKDQYDKANVTYVPSLFYEMNIPGIAYLMSLNGSKVRKLLMDDNKFVSRKVTFSLPAPEESLQGPLQDATYLNFNHAIVNRYFVETKPCEFIINAYNVKSITLLDACERGKIEYYFKAKYTDGTIEVGSIWFDPNHKCDFEWCSFEKYGLSFVPAGDSTRFFDESVSVALGPFSSSRNLKRLYSIISACLRDLNILEIETREYVKQNVSTTRKGEERRGLRWAKVIWVPRKRVIYNKRIIEKLRTFKEKINEIIPVMVQGHLRRVERPSEKQLRLAREYGVFPPPGFTFVKPHTRGIDQNILTRYRSKSALMILYSED